MFCLNLPIDTKFTSKEKSLYEVGKLNRKNEMIQNSTYYLGPRRIHMAVDIEGIAIFLYKTN